jgi:hypothetical protein
MKRTNMISIGLLLGVGLFGAGCDPVQAQSKKMAHHYALENYATYSTKPMNAEEQQGFRDGYERGRRAAKKITPTDATSSKHYRSGSLAYREGFLRGFSAGYHHDK